MSADEIFLLYARHAGKTKWSRIVGPMWTNRKAVDESIAKNVSLAFEYKAVRYVMSEDQDFEAEELPSLLDPRVSGALSQ